MISPGERKVEYLAAGAFDGGLRISLEKCGLPPIILNLVMNLYTALVEGVRFGGAPCCEALLRAGVDYARAHGATLLEAYPVDKSEDSHDDFMWFGAKRLLDRAGFEEVARRKPTRPVVRRRVRPRSRPRRPPG